MEFDLEINRLRNCYGERSYPDERVVLLWKEVCGLDGSWFNNLISKFILHQRVAPLMGEFIDDIRREQNRQKSLDDVSVYNYANEVLAHQDLVSEEERVFYFETIVKRLRGVISDVDWVAFLKLLEPRH